MFEPTTGIGEREIHLLRQNMAGSSCRVVYPAHVTELLCLDFLEAQIKANFGAKLWHNPLGSCLLRKRSILAQEGGGGGSLRFEHM